MGSQAELPSRRVFFVYEGEPDRLDRILLEHIETTSNSLSRSQIKKYIESGAVAVDGIRIEKAGALVKSGARIELAVTEESSREVTPYARAFTVLFEDPSIIVIDKPPDLTMHPGAGNHSRTLVNALQHYWLESRDPAASQMQSLPRAGIVHRLDKDTSGVVVVAKNRHALERLTEQFAARSVGREYVGLARTTPRSTHFSPAHARSRDSLGRPCGTIDGAIGRHPRTRVKMAVLKEGGRRAVTHWNLVERFDYGSLLELHLETGRTHQIRVHLAAIGTPLVGDAVYGDDSPLPRDLRQVAQSFGRQALHARTLTFTHPATGERLSFQSPIPRDYAALIEAFRETRA